MRKDGKLQREVSCVVNQVSEMSEAAEEVEEQSDSRCADNHQ